MADNENLNTEAVEPVEVVHDEVTLPEAKLSAQSADGSGQIEDLDFAAPEGKSLLGATLGATAAEEEQEPDEEYETIPVQELVEVKLGRQGENDTQTVVIDCTEWLDKLPGCTLMIAATRPGEREIYLPEVSVNSGVVTWPILEQDTACAGVGRAEVRAMKDGKVKKSALFRTRVEPALEGDGSPDAPTPPNWVKLIIGSVEEAQASVERLEELVEEATACAINAVRFDEDQGLTDDQKAVGRGNIDAASVAEVTALGNRVTDAEADIDALEAGKVEIADMVSRYAGRKMSFLGDSISTFNAEGYKIDGYNMYYPSGDVTSVEDTWFKQVLDGSGTVIEVNASWSGSRVTNTHPNASYPDFYQRCGLLGNPDVIFVALGTNDSSNNIALGDYDFETATASLSEATFRTAYIKGVKALQANYPNAEIVLLIMSMGDGYADSIRHIGAVLGAQVVDCRGYQGSGVHPGAAGMRWIASRVLYPVDGGLTVAGMAADAAAVGKAQAQQAAQIDGLKQAIAGIDGRQYQAALYALSPELRIALRTLLLDALYKSGHADLAVALDRLLIWQVANTLNIVGGVSVSAGGSALIIGDEG